MPTVGMVGRHAHMQMETLSAATAPCRAICRALRDFAPNNQVGKDTRVVSGQNRALAAIIQTLAAYNDTTAEYIHAQLRI